MNAQGVIPGDRDNALDGLRAVAALLVVFFHCGVNLHIGPVYLPGFMGVHLFFVLSGYLISRPFLARLIESRPLPSWRNYAVRRFVRIYPTYLVALVLFTGMRVAGRLNVPTLPDVLQHALLIFNWGAPENFFSINIVMWTLAIEAQFYVLLPVAVMLAYRFAPHRGRAIAAFVGLAFVAIGLVSRGTEYALTAPGDVRFRLPFSFLDLFAMGMLVAFVELTKAASLRQSRALRRALVVCAGGLLLGANYWLLASGGGDWLSAPTLALVCLYPALVCLGFALVLLVLRTRTQRSVPVLTSAPVVFIGQISYSIYLFHVGVGYFVLTRLPHGPGHWLGAHPLAYALAQLGPVIVVSYLAFLLVERPSLRWVERFSLRARERETARLSR